MVSKITILEPHFDGAQFGPASIPGDQPNGDNQSTENRTDIDRRVPVAEDTTADTGDSKSRLTMALQGLVVFVVMFVTLWVVLSRLLGNTEEDGE